MIVMSPIRGQSMSFSVSRTIGRCILICLGFSTVKLCYGPLSDTFCEALLLRSQLSIRDKSHNIASCDILGRPQTSLSLGDSDNEDSQSSSFDASDLSKRIQQLKDSESEAMNTFTSGIEQRVRELRSAKAIEDKFDSNPEDSSSSLLSLPVICFDALLPNQKLEGSTEDPTFTRFLLEETGLGGWFVMTSFEYRSRKVRRNGVLCKVEFLDAAASSSLNNSDPKKRIPSSLDFIIVGKRRCRMVGKKEGLEARIGRWRRIYDENGEESVLGWGMERFTDELPSSSHDDSDLLSPRIQEEAETSTITDPKQWTTTPIEVHRTDESKNLAAIDPASLDKAESLVPLLDEWVDLASNPDTYGNINVTASVRVRRNQPVLAVDPEALLKRAIAELGERPDPRTHPTNFCFWGGALINPLPALGVSLEIRGNLLEVRTLEERLTILEAGLLRSIQNLKGERSL